ncbi:hypothetical protein [Ferdinandcohnia sp. Marseille-Q9671]
MLIWFRFKNYFDLDSLSIIDFWKLSDGDYATITNRWADIPSWFELHPTEVSDSLVYKILEKLDSGYKPKAKVDGPNIWRIKAGDKLVWIGNSRPGLKEEDGVLEIITFDKNALILGEATGNRIKNIIKFGSGETDKKDILKAQHSMKKIKEEGIPRTYSTEWRLG